MYTQLMDFYGYDPKIVSVSAIVQRRTKILPSAFQQLFHRFNASYNFSMLITENLDTDDDKQNTYRYKTNYAVAIYACLKFYRSDHANPSVLEELIIRSKCPVRP